ncbi:MAG: class I SAM-dependent methyltransferase [Anaerolineales bacterium]|nr:class I SAM-dependent methyltransferase [Anaerolineales bacterium]
MSNINFKMMAFAFQVRDIVRPRADILEEVRLESGARVLDFGCGPGSYTVIAADRVGPAGMVYALDIQPLALQHVQERARKHGLSNIKTIYSSRDTGLETGSLDVVLLYDILHSFVEPEAILEELHRILKPGAVLSINDHHMTGAKIVEKVMSTGLFAFQAKGRHNFTFVKRQ